jgi:hypothetical protein
MRIRGINVLWAVQVQAAGPLGAEAEFPGARDFSLDGEIRLIRVGVDEILPQRKREGKNGKGESRGQIILIGEERTGGKRVEALLIGQIKQVRDGARVQDALENG